MQPYNNDEILVECIRDGLTDETHSGFVLYGNKNEIKNIKGDSGDYPFYLRSCAKPLQAALLIDYGADEFYDLTLDEIAICSASHAGERVHTDIVEKILDKIGLDESYLKCGLHEPLSKTRQYEMKVNNEKLTQVYNNCSGKHAMMLGLCKMNGWDLKTYDDINHPLQIKIRKKINELCEIKKEYPITKDGCGVPIFSMPLKNILKGYLNLFCDNKYFKIRQAFLNYPYLIGGEDRTDTKIMFLNKSGDWRVKSEELSFIDNYLNTINTEKFEITNLCNFSTLHSPLSNLNIIAKVGAGGLCVVVNTEKEEGFIVKISDCDMSARELAVMEMLNKLNWCNININKTLKTLHGDTVGAKIVNL